MDNTIENSLPKSTNSTNDMFSNKNTIIMLLIFLLILSFLGINLLNISGDIVQRISNIFGPVFVNFLSLFGYTTGTVINKTADVVGDAGKIGIDIAEGTAQSVGGLFLKASQNLSNQSNEQPQPQPELKQQPQQKPESKPEPQPDTTKNPIQNPISSIKARWCLVGEYEGRRGCIEINEHDKCLSGQVFPTQQMCLNPTYTSNMPSLKPMKV
uniref:Uncharacterized protein n=1 Tax=viral metagenome TaxID=1070528 RepID=A0A6C0DES6_9ZZZZ